MSLPVRLHARLSGSLLRTLPLLSLSLFLSFALAACGGGGGGGGGGAPMYISTCSLGCSNGATDDSVSCSIGQHSRNGDVSVFFSDAINSATVSPSTFQLIDSGNGQAPVGVRFVDSTDPSGKKMIFRPAVFFDNTGNTVFGFQPGRTYRVSIAGKAHGDLGPFVASTNGQLNQSRMQCEFTTTAVIEDLVSGPPRVSVLVQRAVPGDPTQGSDFEAANGLTDVWRDSQISFRFNDIMNPATLLNPTSHQPTLIQIEVETDGNPNTRVPLFGEVDISIDLIHLRTQLQFTPANGMPSGRAISDGAIRKIVVTVPSNVTDLVGHAVVNPGEFIFTPEVVLHAAATLPDANGEDFANTANKDAVTSGADWGGGRLTRGYGGGSGRLGDLHVPTLQSLTLDGNGTEFRNVSMPDFASSYPIVRTTGLLDNAHPSESPSGPAEYSSDPREWPTIVVTDSVFEFSSLTIDVGATLRIIGTKSARLFSRGPIQIQGTIDVRGNTPMEHPSDDPEGGPGGVAGPGGGNGGRGATRFDNGPNVIIQGLGGIDYVGVANVNGTRGTGVGGTGMRGGGFGGAACPFPGPTQDCMGPTEPELGGVRFSNPGPTVAGTEGNCTVRQVSSPGGGGAYATSGTNAVPMTPVTEAEDPFGGPPVSNFCGAPARGGDAATIGIEPADPESGHRVRLLDAQANLRGGAGGGGGGAQLYDTYQDNTTPTSICYDCVSGFAFLSKYLDHSGSGGGGGGGAIQVASGERIDLSGSIKAAGGDGGSSVFDTLVFPGHDGPRLSRASPGGGGSGGAVHVQAKTVTIVPRDANDPHDTPRIDVLGGFGGVTFGSYATIVSPLGMGGAGGAGLIRLEDLSGGTNPPATLMTRCSEAPKLAPYDPTAGNDPCSTKVLSVGAWAVPSHRPETFSAANSCWMQAPGKYFQLDFPADDLSANPPVYAWNMDIVYHDPVSGSDVLTTYRGRDANTPFATGDFESNLGTAVNYLDAATPAGNEFGTGPFDPGRTGSYIAVRFQGAVADLDDVAQSPCDLTLMGTSSRIESGSLTPWVSHPSELNHFRPRPNIIRFCVVFDRALAVGNTVVSLINGVTNLRIDAQPD